MIEIINEEINTSTNKKLALNDDIYILWDKNSKTFTIMNTLLEKNPECSADEKIVKIVKLSNKQFITLSKDNIFTIWTVEGEILFKYEGHKKEILGFHIYERKDNIYIFSISKNDSIALWSLDGNEIYNHNLKMDTLKKIHLYSDEFQILTETDLIAYELFTGNKIIKFKAQKSFIYSSKLLQNKNILTKDKDSIKLWSKDGEKIKDISITFDFSKVIETDEHKMIILTKVLNIVILDESGGFISEYSPEKSVVDNFEKFIDGRAKLEYMISNKNSIEQFPHRFNPFDKAVTSIDNLKKEQGIEEALSLDENRKIIWNFFNRPIWGNIRNLLKKEEKETTLYKNIFNTSIDKINDEIKSLNKQVPELESSSNIMMIFAVILAVVSIGVGYSVNFFGYGLLVLTVILFINGLNKRTEINEKRSRIKKLENQVSTIEIVYPEMNKFMDDIRRYRYSLFVQIPVIQNKTLYKGSEVQKVIQSLLDTKIHNEAMEYCGLIEDDIIHSDKKPIILNDASLLQSDKKYIDEHNLKSFWFTEDGNVLFAVQYVQFIYLTSDKIDIFSAHYDFIKDKFIRKESQAFYYRDVTNISKKEVERKLLGDNDKSSATQISLKVSSGDAVEFTIFNKDTLKDLNEHIKHESDDNLEQIEELSAQIEELKNSKELDEEKELEIELLESQIEELRNDSSDNEIKFKDNDVNKAIQNIRYQIKKYK